ncbi:hypothetical protein SAMN05444008_108164 [Cnuella takakiae]|uniref:Uncharacterized protein n=1 Tax=Cnuella takakiae TaxID=1302690 RepID=A0A1M5BZF4_9BACT|nr:hypothetical protein [Cnuella takakiae]OLY93567.1 hypothetical protein BUE76_18080 [Cnuella takakiae]SHF47878.1 hypothetical protein SAMN05444008_108164 [Cnuella takakiae]
METFSTVLFVNHAPVGYRVQCDNERAELSPAENPSRKDVAPRIIAEKSPAGWQVQGTDNPELIRQVISELQLTERGPAPVFMSAAP